MKKVKGNALEEQGARGQDGVERRKGGEGKLTKEKLRRIFSLPASSAHPDYGPVRR